MHSALIALDWGTSSLRAYRLGAEGRVLDRRHLPRGLMHLRPAQAEGDGRAADFEQALAEACGDWLQDAPQRPLLACGMVGSAQGWCDAGYLDIPAALDTLATRLACVRRPGAAPLHIVPGLFQHGRLPNVLRGEETQLAGVLAHLCDQGIEAAQWLVGLPGTHSKWVTVQAGVARHFDSFVTGELYALLRRHSLLGQTMADAPCPDAAAFDRGLEIANSDEGRLGPLSTVFSSRTLGLAGRLAPTAQADYLSGLLIGHETVALTQAWRARGPLPRTVLCGEDALCTRYARALALLGWPAPLQLAQASERGLWHIATRAGLV